MESLIKILQIVFLTFKEVSRKKILIGIFTFSLFFLFIFLTCDMKIQINEETRSDLTIQIYIFFLFVSFWNLVLSVLLSSGLISDEIETGNAALILTKPVSREMYLIGKFIGILLLILANISFMMIPYYLKIYLSSNYLANEILFSILLMLNIYSFLVLFLFLVSILIGKMTGVILSIFLLFTSTMLDLPFYETKLGDVITHNQWIKLFLEITYWVVPQLGTLFLHSSSIISSNLTQFHNLGVYSILQVSLWIVIVFVVLQYCFKKKEL